MLPCVSVKEVSQTSMGLGLWEDATLSMKEPDNRSYIIGEKVH